jgi:hypothetical protein
MTKWVVGASFAVAALVLVAVGLNSVRERQQREAEAVRSGGGEGPTAPAAAGSPTAIGPPAAPIATASAAAPVAEHAAPAEAAVGANPPSTEGAGATAGQAAAPGVDPSGLAQATAAALAGIGASPGRESALDSKVALSSRSPRVRDAERALLKGETDRAVVLAQQAVGEDPVDADAWLTLAAARKASGDVSGAREAYHLCIVQAQGADVTDCRILGRSLDNH